MKELKMELPAVTVANRDSTEKREILERKLRQKAASEVQVYPVSHGQNALLFLHRMAPKSPAYNIAFVARIVSEVDPSILERALQRVIDRHATLRTTYEERDGGMCQIVHGAMELELQRVDASAWSDGELTARVHEAFDAPYDLYRGPVFRALLFTRSAEQHVILFGIHHIASDGWSQGIILKELQEFYQAYAAGRSAPMAAPGITYAESVLRRAEMLEGEKGKRLWEYWQKILEGELPALDLPTDRTRPATPSMQGDSCPFKIDAACYGRLKALAKAEGVTFYTLVLAALQVLLMRYTGKEDILVGTPMAARGEPAFEDVVGYFMNSVVIRGNLAGDPTFRDFLKKMRERVLGALSHQEYPFALLVKRLCPEREASRSPIFQVMFNLQSRQTLGPFADLLAGEDSDEPVEFGGLRLKPFHQAQGAGAFDLILELIDTGEIMDGLLMYATDLFERETVTRMAGHFSTLLAQIGDNPDRHLAQYQILPDEERRRLVYHWNNTAVELDPTVGVHHLVWRQAERQPDAIAVVCDDAELTYGTLRQKAQQLAGKLAAVGVAPGHLVGIYVERSLEMVVAILAVLEAGAAYVPLDPSFPAERLALMLGDARCTAVLTQRTLVESLPRDREKALLVDGILDEEAPAPSSGQIAPNLTPEDLAYVIYTSGSTGTPKGVEIPHRALLNHVLSVQREPGIEPVDVFLSVTTISFDIFGLELYLPLVSGARLVVARRDTALDGKALLHAMQRTKVSMMQATPATWRLLLESGWTSAPGLKVLCGGEAFPRELADRILDTGAALWNMYGPTETTIWSAVNRIHRDGTPVSIGGPIANTQLHVLDKQMQPVPIGVSGELYIGGAGLARGYHNRPDLTERSFVPDPFAGKAGARLYRTGDLVRRMNDGSVQFIARMDNQVKIRGYRIELGDIEHHLGQHPEVKNAVVVVHDDGQNGKRLTAYYIPSGDCRPSAHEFREYLKGRLPDYMVPARYVCMEQFPLTPNGKIDRRSLPKPETVEADARLDREVPRDDLERSLLAIWENVLGRQRISLQDNFFDLGGDSLIAARLFAEIGRKTGHDLPLATLFHSPTVEGLAASVRENVRQSSWSILVPMRTGGSKTPLFLVHGAEGNILLYRSLVNHLGDDRPVYGLQSESLDGTAREKPSIEGMASRYIECIRKVLPHGPYYLGGYCMGGTVALEMAQQLQRQGEKVAMLAMFETYNAQRMTARPGRLIDFLFSLQNLVYHFLNIVSIRPEDRKLFLKEKVNTELLRLRAWKDIAISRMRSSVRGEKSEAYRHVQVFRLNDDANRRYVPRPYRGRITLFRPKRQFVGYMDPHYGWDETPSEGIDVRVLPFYPRGMLAEPFVRQLGQELRESLEKSSTTDR